MIRRLFVLCALALVAGLVWNLGAIVSWAMTPTAPFADQPAPPAPDYADGAAWSALPDRDDAGDALPIGVAGVDQRHAPVDVFYVHPTSYVGGQWSGPVDDPALNEATDRVATGIQATAFNGCCAVYAPRYRQANGTAFVAASADGARAIDRAYGDVRRAFEAFEARRGRGRPFILAGHSQGAVIGERLLREVIAPSSLRDQLVVAVLPGAAIPASAGLTACAGPDDTGCVIAWNARGPRWRPGRFDMDRPRPWLCTNPLSGRADEARVVDNPGAVFLEADRAVRPGFADAQCADGVLIVRDLGAAPRDLPSAVLDYVLGPENYHPMEYQLFFMAIREDAARRVAAALAR